MTFLYENDIGEEFEFFVKDGDIIDALSEITNADYFNNMANDDEIANFIYSYCNLKALKEDYKQKLADYFEERAKREVRNEYL